MNLAQSNEAADAPLLTRRDGAVFHVILNRPETRNPLGVEMVEHLEDALFRAESDAAVRVVAVSAAGPAFSAGGNLGNIADRIAAQPDADGQDPVAMGNRRYGRFLERFAGSSKITVVLAQGAAMGGRRRPGVRRRPGSRRARLAFRFSRGIDRAGAGADPALRRRPHRPAGGQAHDADR